MHVNKGQGHLEVMYDTDNEETQRGQRPWLPPGRGAGRGRGLLAASQWSPDSAEVAVSKTTLVDTVPMGCGRPRGDATTCPMDKSMTSHPTVIEPGNAGRGGGGRVIVFDELGICFFITFIFFPALSLLSTCILTLSFFRF